IEISFQFSVSSFQWFPFRGFVSTKNFKLFMNSSHLQWLKRLPALFEIPAPDPARLLRRIVMMERNVMLPVKIFFIGAILYSFKYSPWVGQILSPLDVT